MSIKAYGQSMVPDTNLMSDQSILCFENIPVNIIQNVSALVIIAVSCSAYEMGVAQFIVLHCLDYFILVVLPDRIILSNTGVILLITDSQFQVPCHQFQIHSLNNFGLKIHCFPSNPIYFYRQKFVSFNHTYYSSTFAFNFNNIQSQK